MTQTFTKEEAMKLAVQAAELALARAPEIRATMTTAEAARRLGVSSRSIHRMNPARVGGKIPYTWVLKQLE